MSRFSRLDVYQRMLDEGLVSIFVQAEPDNAAQALATSTANPTRTSQAWQAVALAIYAASAVTAASIARRSTDRTR
jgi:hypothetical protein